MGECWRQRLGSLVSPDESPSHVEAVTPTADVGHDTSRQAPNGRRSDPGPMRGVVRRRSGGHRCGIVSNEVVERGSTAAPGARPGRGRQGRTRRRGEAARRSVRSDPRRRGCPPPIMRVTTARSRGRRQWERASRRDPPAVSRRRAGLSRGGEGDLDIATLHPDRAGGLGRRHRARDGHHPRCPTQRRQLGPRPPGGRRRQLRQPARGLGRAGRAGRGSPAAPRGPAPARRCGHRSGPAAGWPGRWRPAGWSSPASGRDGGSHGGGKRGAWTPLM